MNYLDVFYEPEVVLNDTANFPTPASIFSFFRKHGQVKDMLIKLTSKPKQYEGGVYFVWIQGKFEMFYYLKKVNANAVYGGCMSFDAFKAFTEDSKRSLFDEIYHFLKDKELMFSERTEELMLSAFAGYAEYLDILFQDGVNL